MKQFGEEEEIKLLTNNIKKLSTQLHKDLKNLEKKIKIYINPENYDFEIQLQLQIKDNMNQNILSEYNSLARNFKLIKENYSQKSKELLQDDQTENLFEINEISTMNEEQGENKGEENFLMQDEPDLLLEYRENEIKNIVNGVNQLGGLFKDLNVIVIEQGTILDRIDYNIDVTFDNVVKGKKKIISANESQKNSCFRNVILILLLTIFIETTLVLFKFF